MFQIRREEGNEGITLNKEEVIEKKYAEKRKSDDKIGERELQRAPEQERSSTGFVTHLKQEVMNLVLYQTHMPDPNLVNLTF